MAPQTAEPEQAEIAAGRTSASSNARATPTMVTHAPLPPEPTTPTRPVRRAAAGRLSNGGRTSAGTGSGRSITGSGSSARLAFIRKPRSVAAATSSRARPTRSSTRFTLNGSRASRAMAAVG
jgi:hypothetical protein